MLKYCSNIGSLSLFSPDHLFVAYFLGGNTAAHPWPPREFTAASVLCIMTTQKFKETAGVELQTALIQKQALAFGIGNIYINCWQDMGYVSDPGSYLGTCHRNHELDIQIPMWIWAYIALPSI